MVAALRVGCSSAHPRGLWIMATHTAVSKSPGGSRRDSRSIGESAPASRACAGNLLGCSLHPSTCPPLNGHSLPVAQTVKERRSVDGGTLPGAHSCSL